MIDTGTVLQGRYVVQEVLAQNSAATTYGGHLLNLSNKRVAIWDMAVGERSQEEANVLAGLGHPALPQVVDYFTDGGRAFLVVDRAPGRPLDRLLADTDGFLPVDAVLHLFQQLCDVVAYCHGRPSPVVLGDLHPGHIMVDEDGRVKLLDCGLQRRLAASPSPGYAAVELYMASGPIGPSTDVYALGAILYTMLTRLTPPSAVELATGQTHMDPPDRTNSALSPAWVAFLGAMMASQAAERYQSIEQVQAGLLQVLDNPAPVPAEEPVALVAGEEDTIGAWRQKRRCPKCGAEGKPGTEICASCGHHLRRRVVSLRDPQHAHPTQPLNEPPPPPPPAPPEPLDFRHVPDELQPIPVEVQALVQMPQGFLDVLTSKATMHETVHVLEVSAASVRFLGTYDYAVGAQLLMRMVVPVLATGDHTLIDTRIVVTHVGGLKQGMRPYTATFKGLPADAAALLDTLKSQERRKARRFARGVVIVSKDLPEYKAITLDISATGLGFLSSRGMPVGELVELVIDPDDVSLPPATVLVSIISSTELADDRYRIGVRFERLNDKSNLILRRFLKMMA